MGLEPYTSYKNGKHTVGIVRTRATKKNIRPNDPRGQRNALRAKTSNFDALCASKFDFDGDFDRLAAVWNNVFDDQVAVLRALPAGGRDAGSTR